MDRRHRLSPSSCRKILSRPSSSASAPRGEYVIKAGEADDEPVVKRRASTLRRQYITREAMGYLAINQNAPVVKSRVTRPTRYEEVIPLMVAPQESRCASGWPVMTIR